MTQTAMSPAGYQVRAFSPADYDCVIALWKNSEGVGLNESDTREAITAFLARNPGLSLVASDSLGEIVAAVLCGHDGRRGYLHHLAVAGGHRRRGLGRHLVESCLERLRESGIQKCNIFLFADNEPGRGFWLRSGWGARADLVVVQKKL